MGIGAYFSIALILTASTPFPIFYKYLYLIDLFQKRQTPKIIPLLLILEMFYLNSTLNFGMPPILVFQLEVYYKVVRLLTGLTAQQKGTTARWYSNKTFLHNPFV